MLAFVPGTRNTLNYFYSEALRWVVLSDGELWPYASRPCFHCEIRTIGICKAFAAAQLANSTIEFELEFLKVGCFSLNSESLVPPQVAAWSPGSKTRDQGTLHCIDRSRLHCPSGRRRSQELRLAHYSIRSNQKRPYRPRLSLTAISISCSDQR